MNTMMGINCPTGSHLVVLEPAVAALEPGVLVIEHGAGLYSTPLLARTQARIICAEPHEGWGEWAHWIYQGRAEIVNSFKRVAPILGEAAIVFIDGPANERGPLLALCLERGVPVIICHDTEEREWDHYGHKRHFFEHPRYTVTQHTEDSHRTTRWVKRA